MSSPKTVSSACLADHCCTHIGESEQTTTQNLPSEFLSASLQPAFSTSFASPPCFFTNPNRSVLPNRPLLLFVHPHTNTERGCHCIPISNLFSSSCCCCYYYYYYYYCISSLNRHPPDTGPGCVLRCGACHTGTSHVVRFGQQ